VKGMNKIWFVVVMMNSNDSEALWIFVDWDELHYYL